MSEMLKSAREAQEGVTMDKKSLPRWLFPGVVIFGAEEESSGGTDGAEGTENEGTGDEDSGSNDEGNEGDDDGSDDDDDSGDDSGRNVEGLLKALKEERRKNREHERKQKKIERDRQRASASKEELLTETQKELEASNTRVSQLAGAFRESKLNAAIESAARKARFRDTDDALAMVNRDLIVVDQDEDNPADVDIDQKSVDAAVKKLASSKRHLIASGTNDDQSTGGQFGTKGGSKKTTEEEFRAKYPNL